MTANINPQTGTPYGIISSSVLNSEVVDDLLFTYGDDLSYKEAAEEFVEQFNFDPVSTTREYGDLHLRHYTDDEIIEMLVDEGLILIDEDTNQPVPADDIDQLILDYFNFNDHYENPELIVEGVYEEVHYRSTWIGGALNFFIFQSPFITDKANVCSPCVPNAGNLDDLDGDYTCYDVPPDWREDTEQ